MWKVIEGLEDVYSVGHELNNVQKRWAYYVDVSRDHGIDAGPRFDRLAGTCWLTAHGSAG